MIVLIRRLLGDVSNELSINCRFGLFYLGPSIKDVHTPRGEGGFAKSVRKVYKGEGEFSNCVRTHF